MIYYVTVSYKTNNGDRLYSFKKKYDEIKTNNIKKFFSECKDKALKLLNRDTYKIKEIELRSWSVINGLD